MTREAITVEKRTITGKKVKTLRKQGILPANVYGKDFASQAVQLGIKEFTTLYKKVGETGLVDLRIDSQTIPVLIHNIHSDPKSQTPLHADFYKVNLKEKIEAQVPIVALGESPAVADNKGILLALLQELDIEALPTDLPEKIEVSIENLAEVGDQITVAQLKVPSGVTILNEVEQAVFRIGELVQEEPAEEEVVPVEGTETPAESQTTEGNEQPAEES